MGIRQKRLGDEIRDILARCFQADGMNDPRLNGVLISRVVITADLQLASVYFRLYDTDNKSQALDGLEHCKGYLRKAIAAEIKMRRVPELRFFYDEMVEKHNRIEELLRQAKDS